MRKRRNHLSGHVGTIPEMPNPSYPRVEPFTFPPAPQDAPIASQNHHQPNYNPSSPSFSPSSNSATTTGYQSTFPASGIYDDYVSSNAVRIPLPRTFKSPCLCRLDSRTTTGQSAKIVRGWDFHQDHWGELELRVQATSHRSRRGRLLRQQPTAYYQLAIPSRLRNIIPNY